MAGPRVAVGLVHHPVVDKNGREIASAVTPTDLHDLARSARTYGVAALWIITPLRDQQKLAQRMMKFWQTGVGAGYNPNRGQALDLVRIVNDLDEALDGQAGIWGEEPLVWATSASQREEKRLGYSPGQGDNPPEQTGVFTARHGLGVGPGGGRKMRSHSGAASRARRI